MERKRISLYQNSSSLASRPEPLPKTYGPETPALSIPSNAHLGHPVPGVPWSEQSAMKLVDMVTDVHTLLENSSPLDCPYV